MFERKLAAIDVKPGGPMESQSGIQMMQPRIYGAYEAHPGAKTACILMHPVSNFFNHYLITPLAERGLCAMGLNSRYVQNDSVLIMERVIQDLGAGVQFLRGQGYEKVILIGNCGGAALASFYQAQAECLTLTETPAGDPIDIVPADLPPADGIVIAAAPCGRARVFTEWLDAAAMDESEPLATDPELDIFDPRHGPPFSPEFVMRVRQAQVARRDRIEQWVEDRLAFLRAVPGGPRDQAFVIHRTLADPRFVDLTLDANDRPKGSIWGDPQPINAGPNSMGRYSTLTSFMSQWSSRTRADGPTNLAKTRVPVLSLEYTADAAVFPSHLRDWHCAALDRVEVHPIKGAPHYPQQQPRLVAEVADRIADWVGRV